MYALFSTFNWDGDGFHHSKEVKSKTNGKSGWKFLQLTCSTGATKWVWIWAITMIICTSRCIRTLIPKINYLSILARFPSLVASFLLCLPICLSACLSAYQYFVCKSVGVRAHTHAYDDFNLLSKPISFYTVIMGCDLLLFPPFYFYLLIFMLFGRMLWKIDCNYFIWVCVANIDGVVRRFVLFCFIFAFLCIRLNFMQNVLSFCDDFYCCVCCLCLRCSCRCRFYYCYVLDIVFITSQRKDWVLWYKFILHLEIDEMMLKQY